MKARLKRLAGIIVTLGLINGCAATVAALLIGGTAEKVENGHYYVAEHGRYTEVSRAVWLYSRAHVTIVEITAPLLLLALVTLAYRESHRVRLST